MGVREFKNEIRERTLKERASISENDRILLDNMLMLKFLKLLCYKHARSIILYASIKSEPDTMAIIKTALKDGKNVALPRCITATHEMEFYKIDDINDLAKGSYGILEPDIQKCEKINPFSYDIVLVPALTFDKFGYRIGYGKGYYDRFLDKFCGTKIGITYSFLMEGHLPRGRYDRNVDILVTEKGVKMVADD